MTPSLASVYQTDITSIQGSHFQGHAAPISSVKGAAKICDALFQSNQVANVQHVVYTYIITDDSGMKIMGHSDDGEWAALRIILKLLKDKQNKIFVAVSRICDGLNLGQKRFTAITSAATAVMNMF